LVEDKMSISKKKTHLVKEGVSLIKYASKIIIFMEHNLEKAIKMNWS
jgi:hypothetical protein